MEERLSDARRAVHAEHERFISCGYGGIVVRLRVVVFVRESCDVFAHGVCERERGKVLRLDRLVGVCAYSRARVASYESVRSES